MKIGVQLYTLRDAMDADAVGTLGRLADLGYRNVELAGLAGLEAAEFRAALDKFGLKAISAHVGLDALEERLDETMEMALAVGVSWLVVPWVDTKTFQDLPAFAIRAGKVGAAVSGRGLGFCYHNHSFEFEIAGTRPAFERFWEDAPIDVQSELDLYWVSHGGHDPVCWLDTLRGRVPLTHFKDGKDGKHTPVGEGELDWDAIIPVAKEAGVKYAFVELDECPRDPFDCVSASRDFLIRKGLKD